MKPGPGLTIFLVVMSWVLVSAVIIALLTVIVKLLLRLRPACQDPTCGQCGYIITGLPSSICPECGANLIDVGILPAGKPKPLSRRTKGIIWTFGLAPVAALGVAIISDLAPREACKTEDLEFRPASRAYAQIAIHIDSWGPSPDRLQTKRLTFSLKLAATNGAASDIKELTVEPNTFGYRYVRPSGQMTEAPNGFDAHVLLDWLKANGVEGNPAVQQEANDVFAHFRAAITGNLCFAGSESFIGRSGSITHGDRRPVWPRIALWIFWAMVWIAGLRFLLRRPKNNRRPQNAELPEKSVESA